MLSGERYTKSVIIIACVSRLLKDGVSIRFQIVDVFVDGGAYCAR